MSCLWQPTVLLRLMLCVCHMASKVNVNNKLTDMQVCACVCIMHALDENCDLCAVCVLCAASNYKCAWHRRPGVISLKGLSIQ